MQPHGPYYLGGYSGGGVAAFEMAQQLTAAGEEVAFVGFIDSYSPVLPKRALRDRSALHLARARKQGPTYLIDTARRRFDYQRGTIALRARSALGAFFPQQYRYESLQGSWLVAESRYRPTPWDGKATLFRAREGMLWTAYDLGTSNGWERYLKQGVGVELCPGNHATMCEEPNVRVLAAKLRHALDAAATAQLAAR